MTPLRAALFVVGLAAIVWLVSRLPADVFLTTQAFLLIVAAASLILAATAFVFLPARKLQARLFGLSVTEGALFGFPPEREARATLQPLLVAAVCFAVAGLAGLVRALAA